MAQPFQDCFSEDASAYARFRPAYPAALFEWLASLTPRRELAWDVGTGSGQAAVGLAEHFRQVVATDASAAQIANARPHPGVVYRIAVAGKSGLAAATADLVTVGQALHWFDRTAFFREAAQVLAPEGAIAVWCYGLLRVFSEVDGVTEQLYADLLGEWWPPDRRLVDDGYRSIEFPFHEIPAPELIMEALWTLPQLLGYLGTWSGVRRCRAETGVDPVQRVVPRLAAAWGDPDGARWVRWPLSFRVGRPG